MNAVNRRTATEYVAYVNGRFAPVCLLVSVSVCVAMRFAHRGASRQAMRFAHRGPSRQEGVCYGYSQCEVVFAGWVTSGTGAITSPLLSSEVKSTLSAALSARAQAERAAQHWGHK